MFTVMRDPVLLPSSKTILDRATIKSHLLSDSKDPFNRAPLSIEDVVAGKFHDLSARLLYFTFLLHSSRVEVPYRRVLDREAEKTHGCRCTIRGGGNGHLTLNHESIFRAFEHLMNNPIAALDCIIIDTPVNLDLLYIISLSTHTKSEANRRNSCETARPLKGCPWPIRFEILFYL